MVSPLPLTLSGAVVRRGGGTRVGPFDLTLGPHGITAVMGPNGAGKTTLLRLMHGLERPREGQLTWSTDLETARAGAAFVFQTPVMMRRSVVASIAVPLRLRGAARAEAIAKARALCDKVGLAHAADRPARQLSGGERQKLALARAMITAPAVLFLDEPCSNLDGRATRDIEALISDAARSGTRVVLATHDIGQARRLADDVIFLARGRVVETQDAASFFDAPRSDEARAHLKGDIVE